MSSLFDAVEMAPRDPILGLNEQFAADPNPAKVNLGVGVYSDENGKLPLLRCIREAEKMMVEAPQARGYLPIDGMAAYDGATQALVFGEAAARREGRIATVQAVGGTGALKVGADLLQRLGPQARVLISEPSWENHRALFEAAGFEVGTYPYYDAATKAVDFEAMRNALAAATPGTIVVLHACCHNPTGCDLTQAQWPQVVELLASRGLVPFLDLAYQGFGDGLAEDARAVHLCLDAGLDFFVATSYSKSFSLYGERAGALSVVCASKDAAARVLSQLKRVIRTNYSNPPTHGAAAITAVLTTLPLRALWEDELAGMRDRIKRMRVELQRRLVAAGAGIDTDFITRQRGMFSYTGLTKAQMQRLRSEFGVYGVDSGRICVAALNERNLDAVVAAIAQVTEKGFRMMLYEWYEAQRALLSPFSEFASASSKLYNHPLSLFAHTPNAHRVSAGLELMHRLAKDYEKPEFDIRSILVDKTEVVVHEQVAVEKPFCRLLRFKRFTDDLPMLQRLKVQPTVLVVAPLSGHHSTLLRETVRELLKSHKVFITDWTDARMVPEDKGPFHLADYVAYVQEFIRFVGPEVNVISVCQPTVPVLAAISLMASAGEETPRTMTMMGGPIDARKSPTAVNNLATNKSLSWFENNVIHRVPVNYPGAGRAVYPGFLQHAGFIAMNPDRHLKSHYDYFLDLMRGDGDNADFHRGFYDEYNAVLDMPAEYYLDTIKTVFQDFALVNGAWRIGGELVRPQDIRTTALLTIEGELDDISGAGQTRAAHDLCTGVPAERRFHYDALGAGHYGIFSGRRWREKVYPKVRDFIAAHQEPAGSVEKKRAAARSKRRTVSA